MVRHSRPALAGLGHTDVRRHTSALLVLAGLTWVGFFGLLAYSTWLAGAGASTAIIVAVVGIVPGALVLIAGGIGGYASRGR